MKTKLIILSIFNLLICNLLIAQSINTTLGPLGVFTIKDASNDFFTLSQSTGQINILRALRLEFTTNPTTGVIFKGTDRFIHNYGTDNTFLGINSGNFTMTGSGNAAFGDLSLSSNTSGNYNSAFGLWTLRSNTSGSGNSAFGNISLRSNTSGGANSAFGIYSLYNNTTGGFNSALGVNSLYSNTFGSNNSALGVNSLFSNTSGSNNSAFGYYSLTNNTIGVNNSAFGVLSGSNITSGSNLTLIGYNAQPTSGTTTNQITLGNNSVTSLRCNVTTITSLSDARDKKNITDLGLGIDFLMKLKPRIYNWDKREWYDNNISDGTKIQDAPTAGFIAQELDEAQTSEGAEWLNLVLKDNPEKWEATPGNLLPVMVKAIQELNDKCTTLESENNRLKTEIETLNDMKFKLAELEQSQIELIKIIKSGSTNQFKSIKVSDNK